MVFDVVSDRKKIFTVYQTVSMQKRCFKIPLILFYSIHERECTYASEHMSKGIEKRDNDEIFFSY